MQKAGTSKAETQEAELLMESSVLDYLQHGFPVPLSDELHRYLVIKYQEKVQRLEAATGEEFIPDEGIDRTESMLREALQAQIEIARFQRRLLVHLHKAGSFTDETIRQLENNLDIASMKLDLQRASEEG